MQTTSACSVLLVAVVAAVTWYRSGGEYPSPTYAKVTGDKSSVGCNGIVIADVNNDTFPDVVVSSYTATAIRVLVSSGDVSEPIAWTAVELSAAAAPHSGAPRGSLLAVADPLTSCLHWALCSGVCGRQPRRLA